MASVASSPRACTRQRRGGRERADAAVGVERADLAQPRRAGAGGGRLPADGVEVAVDGLQAVVLAGDGEAVGVGLPGAQRPVAVDRRVVDGGGDVAVVEPAGGIHEAVGHRDRLELPRAGSRGAARGCRRTDRAVGVDRGHAHRGRAGRPGVAADDVEVAVVGDGGVGGLGPRQGRGGVPGAERAVAVDLGEVHLVAVGGSVVAAREVHVPVVGNGADGPAVARQRGGGVPGADVAVGVDGRVVDGIDGGAGGADASHEVEVAVREDGPVARAGLGKARRGGPRRKGRRWRRLRARWSDEATDDTDGSDSDCSRDHLRRASLDPRHPRFRLQLRVFEGPPPPGHSRQRRWPGSGLGLGRCNLV